MIKSGCSGFACQYSYGLSIYFPWALVSPEYVNLSFAKDLAEGGTGWLEFLDTHIIATRRDPRYPPEQFLPTRVDLRLKRLRSY